MVTLGRYEGLSSDAGAPDWTRMPTGIAVELRQPCYAIADVFAELAFWPENNEIVCKLTFKDSTRFLYFCPAQPVSHNAPLVRRCLRESNYQRIDMSHRLTIDSYLGWYYS